LKKGAGEALLQGGKSNIRKQVYKYEDGKVVFYKADEQVFTVDEPEEVVAPNSARSPRGK
jgi:hypothetical protein